MPFVFTPGQLTARAEFYHQLGSLTAAGLTLPRAAEQLQHSPPARALGPVAAALQLRLQQGLTPSEAIGRIPKFAPAFDLALIEAGERSGRLDQVFKLLATHYQGRAQLTRQMLGLLAYPAFLAHVAVVVFPIRYLTGLLDAGGGTRFLIQKLGLLLPVYALIILGIYACQGSHGETWRAFLERAFRPVPWLGKSRRNLALSRFATALEALINAGINIVQALPLAAAASGSPALKNAAAWMHPRIESGVTPAEAMRNAGFFPAMFANLYTSGEVSGKQDETLLRLHAHYHEEGSRQLRNFALWTGHALHLAIMLAIAWQVISFYLGYFNQLNDVMK